MLDNPDYRKSEYLDFKRNFAFLEMEKGKQRDEKFSEFRSDVCAFANSDGGYLIFGIGEEKGVAHELIGIDIPDDNTDKFELDRKNNLNSISSQIPPAQFKFLKMEAGKYIVIIHVQHDFFAPLLHIIPETFLNSLYDKNLFLMEKRGKISFDSIFGATECDGYFQPNVDGLRNMDTRGKRECLLFNNGNLEFFLPFETNYLVCFDDVKFKNGVLYFENVFESLPKCIEEYMSLFTKLYEAKRYFVCASIIGCKGVTSFTSGHSLIRAIIDRNKIVCPPTVL